MVQLILLSHFRQRFFSVQVLSLRDLRLRQSNRSWHLLREIGRHCYRKRQLSFFDFETRLGQGGSVLATYRQPVWSSGHLWFARPSWTIENLRYRARVSTNARSFTFYVSIYAAGLARRRTSEPLSAFLRSIVYRQQLCSHFSFAISHFA